MVLMTCVYMFRKTKQTTHWEYLHHRSQQTPQIRAGLPSFSDCHPLWQSNRETAARVCKIKVPALSSLKMFYFQVRRYHNQHSQLFRVRGTADLADTRTKLKPPTSPWLLKTSTLTVSPSPRILTTHSAPSLCQSCLPVHACLRSRGPLTVLVITSLENNIHKREGDIMTTTAA